MVVYVIISTVENSAQVSSCQLKFVHVISVEVLQITPPHYKNINHQCSKVH